MIQECIYAGALPREMGARGVTGLHHGDVSAHTRGVPRRGSPMFSKLVSALISGVVLLAGAVSYAPAASARSFKSCESLVATYPNGVAKNKKSANRWVARGYGKPRVNTKVYRRNAGDLNTSRGVICGTTLKEIRSANARAYADLFLNGTGPQIRAGGPMVAPGSPAALYLDYWANTVDAFAWEEYGSRGVIQPPPAPEPVREKKTTGSTVTYQVGENADNLYTFSFDDSNRVTSWSTSAGDLAPRLKAVSGQVTSEGLTIQVLQMYETNNGPVALTALVTNNRPGEAGVLYTAVYNTSSGRYPALTTRACLQPGQTAPVFIDTEIDADLQLPSSWEIRFAADADSCNAWSDETVLTVPVNPTQ